VDLQSETFAGGALRKTRRQTCVPDLPAGLSLTRLRKERRRDSKREQPRGGNRQSSSAHIIPLKTRSAVRNRATAD
jgi:hypothetical protein